MSRPRLLSGTQIVLGKFANEAMFWWPIGVAPYPELREEMRKNQSMATLVAGYSACNSVSLRDLDLIRGVRIAITAGGQRDDVEMTRKFGRVLGGNNSDCKAFVVREAVHLWDLQFPELFAKGIRAWVERSEMPEEFEVLI